MAKTNLKLRQTMMLHEVKQWQLADLIGKSEMTVTRMLRHELPEEKQEELIALIEDYAKEQVK